MTSKAFPKNTSLDHESSSPEVMFKDESIKSRKANVYDAVAGNISATGFIPILPVFSSTRDTPSSSTAAVPPDAVLFRRKNAPVRYAEDDFYFANEKPLRTDLPDSDLLKALHSHSSHFYSRATIDQGTGDWRTLDETALIAMGILMEETSRDVLGQTGDLVFTEGEQFEAPISNKGSRSVEHPTGTKGRRPKRRRINEE